MRITKNIKIRSKIAFSSYLNSSGSSSSSSSSSSSGSGSGSNSSSSSNVPIPIPVLVLVPNQSAGWFEFEFLSPLTSHFRLKRVVHKQLILAIGGLEARCRDRARL